MHNIEHEPVERSKNVWCDRHLFLSVSERYILSDFTLDNDKLISLCAEKQRLVGYERKNLILYGSQVEKIPPLVLFNTDIS